MSTSLRCRVLQSFKQLHRTRKIIFKDDAYALSEGRKKINEEFKKQKHINNVDSIDELINYANSVEKELRTCIIQAREVEPGRYQVQITKDTVKLDNIPFSDCPNEKSLKKNS